MAAETTAGEALASFLAASDEDEAGRALGELIEQHATLLIRRVARHRLADATADVEDVSSIVTMQLMMRLQRERAKPSSPIASFAGYVATMTHHGCDQFLRTRHPLRWRLRNRIRYVLEHDSRFALWKTDETWTCGLRAWLGRPASRRLVTAPRRVSIPVDAVVQLLLQLFPADGEPLPLAVVVDAAAAAWGIQAGTPDGNADPGRVIDPAPRADQVLEQRDRLSRIWDGVRDLPLRQRHALLLNMKDDAVTVLLTTGAATLRSIAELLEMPVDELAALWNRLPLSDNAIAERLGCTRQQVINLRMSARKRLANRMSAEANIGEGGTL